MNETQNEEQLRFPDDIMEEGGNLAGRIEAILFVAGRVTAARRFASCRRR